MPNARASFSTFLMETFRTPRSTWLIYVECNLNLLATSACDSFFFSRASLTRFPNLFVISIFTNAIVHIVAGAVVLFYIDIYIYPL
jgi:hypothetical protein